MAVTSKLIISCDEIHPLTEVDGTPQYRCCDEDYLVGSIADIDADLERALCCRRTWCVKVRNWGNDGTHPVDRCKLSTLGPVILDDPIKDYINKFGCGSNEGVDGPFRPVCPGEVALGGGFTTAVGSSLFGIWGDNTGDISPTVTLSILNNNSIPNSLTGGAEPLFDGASLDVSFEDFGGVIYIRAYKIIRFPFTVGALYGPHCQMKLSIVGPTTRQAQCTRGTKLIDIW